VAASATVVVAAVFLVRPELRETPDSRSAELRQETMIAQKQEAAESDAAARAAKDAAPVVTANAAKPATIGAAAGQRGRADASPASPPAIVAETARLVPPPPPPSAARTNNEFRIEANEPAPGRAMAPVAPAPAEQAASEAEKKSYGNAAEPLTLQKKAAPQTAAHYSLADVDASKSKADAKNDNVVASDSLEYRVKDDGKARESGPAMFSTMNSKAVGGVVSKEREQGLARAKGDESQARTWRIREGKLESSRDGGKTWARADAPGGARFLAVDARRANVWAGGTSGVVIRSDDNGATWVPVTTGWTGDVTYLKFDDEKHGTLKTSTGEEWFTDDGGSSWKKK
jgi:hypothetical protein